MITTPWRRVTGLPEDLVDHVADMLQTVDTMQRLWLDAVADVPAEEVEAARKRSLTRHAIETGILERLYDVEWGVTEALIAEGLTAEVAQRAGGLDDGALTTIQGQLEALEYLRELVQSERPLSISVIRELHVLITQTQGTYLATDALGRRFQKELLHGQWKAEPNHVDRPDGTRLEYTPPDHVASELEVMLSLLDRLIGVHPVLRSAWLHHRFIAIHPFQDGNGRVARALVLLELMKARLAPLVVPRQRRDDYLAALDLANDGDLAPLARLFAQLEIEAVRAELAVPAPRPASSVAVEVARAYGERIAAARAEAATARAARITALAEALHDPLCALAEDQARGIAEAFRPADTAAWARPSYSRPGEEQGHWFRHELVEVARALGFYANLYDGTWWVGITMRVLDQRLRWVLAIQRVGRGDTGVLAATAFAQSREETQAPEAANPWQHLIPLAELPSVTLVEDDQPGERFGELADLLEKVLTAGVDAFSRRLGA